MHPILLLAALSLITTPARAASHRFSSPLSIELVSVESLPCARPLAGTGATASTTVAAGHCLSADLAVVHRGADGSVQQEAVTYLLGEGFAERLALDFGPFAPVALRELGRGIEAAGLDGDPRLQPLAQRCLQQVRRHVRYQLQPHVVLPLEVEAAVARVADRFHGRTRRPLVITSGPRSPESQALAMYLKLIQGVALHRLYRKTAAAMEIRAAYRTGQKERKRHRDIIALMAEVIRQQIARGVYISPHLKGGAVDIRSRNLSPAAKAALQRAVAGFKGMRLIREEKTPPHFHLEINLEPTKPSGLQPLARP